jgi:hypothetical protein
MFSVVGRWIETDVSVLRQRRLSCVRCA